jgi:hypothetical protein
MKILYFISTCSTLLLASSLPTTVATGSTRSTEEAPVFVPTRISYQDLQNVLEEEDSDDNNVVLVRKALQNVGLFSITDIPLFGKEKPETLESLPACVNALLLLQQKEEKFRGNNAARHVFPDGTIRKTIATTGDQHSLLLLNNNDDASGIPESCEPLQQVSGAFRDTVAEVTRTVGMILLRLLNDNHNNNKASSSAEESLVWNQARDKAYNIADLVTFGEHLEHFHVYEKTSTTTRNNKDDDQDTNKSTLDWHTDQGLMLIFTPGTTIKNGEPSQNDFYIQLANGQAVSVSFDIKDELVVMLGEGIHHYSTSSRNNMMLNPKDENSFRAVLHRLSVRSGNGERVWYGRMVLPPSDAVHPLHQRTFGDLRQEMMTAHPHEKSFLGCSSNSGSTSSLSLAAYERYLETQDITEEESCNPDTQFFCWHRCMNYTELVSPTACEAVTTSDAPQEVACHNPDTKELWPETHDPDFELGCVDSMIVAAFHQQKNNASTTSPPKDPSQEEVVVVDGEDDHDSDHHDESEKEGPTAPSSGFVVRLVDGTASLTTATAVLWGSSFLF